MDMEYLKYRIRKDNMNLEEFAQMIGISRTSFYKKLKGETEWTCEEMKKIKDTFNLSVEEFNKIFGF